MEQAPRHLSAHRAFCERLPGFYVVNPITQIAVAHTEGEGQALVEATKRNKSFPLTPPAHYLRVVEIVKQENET